MKEEINKILEKAGVKEEIVLTAPPKPEMGDYAFACFDLAKEWKMSPPDAAKKLVSAIASEAKQSHSLLEKIQAIGPYVNFFLNGAALAKLVLKSASKKDFGASKIGKGKKVMVEFAHPNTHKQFHIGHLRNIVTGESVVRVLENAGNKVVRANYQGDIGMHIAKCLYGISRNPNNQIPNPKSIDERAKLLGVAYAAGAKAHEEDERARQEIEAINAKIYSHDDKEINKLYKETRKWSLEYFDKIYKRVGSKFDRLYFESETFERGKETVLKFLNQEVFKKSDGAVIFEGEKYGLHNRVFLNSRGLPTYEAKDLALAELQFKEYKPDFVLHVVAREQAEYFKVMFKALEFTLPASKGKEKHLVYGWVSLKDGKMSSRSGNVVLGEWLLDEVKKKIAEITKEHEIKNREEMTERVAVAAVKYAFLRTGIANDIVFDINQSVSLTGDSGPYLLYIIARIKSILSKVPSPFRGGIKGGVGTAIKPPEKFLLMKLSEFPEATAESARETDPSKIAHYLLGLAQCFNNFYDKCPVLKAEPEALSFRLKLIEAVKKAMEKGLRLLGIETVEEM